MQVSVEVTSELGRRLTVELPWDAFKECEERELKKRQKSAKVPGFRPGKAPLEVVRRHSRDLRQTVIFELMQKNAWLAIEEINNDATQPKLNLGSRPDYEMPVIEEGQVVKLFYRFEVLPSIDVKYLTGVDITKLSAELTEGDVDKTIEKLRHQLREWEDVSRAAIDNDRVIIDFEGFIDDHPFDGNKATHFSLELGSNRMIPGFEAALLGVTPGQDLSIDVTFPADYHAKELAGKTAKFNIHVHQVQASILPDVDEKFATHFGISDGSIEGLRKELRDSMARELDISLRNKLKQETFDKLLEVNQFDIPRALLEQEIERMREDMESKLRIKIDKSRASGLFSDGAKRRLMLSFLVEKIVEQHDIKAHADRVKALIEQRASAFENPEEMIKMYFGTKDLMDQMESIAIEEQVVEQLLLSANVIEKVSTFMDVMDKKQ